MFFGFGLWPRVNFVSKGLTLLPKNETGFVVWLAAYLVDLLPNKLVAKFVVDALASTLLALISLAPAFIIDVASEILGFTTLLTNGLKKGLCPGYYFL